MKKGCLCKRERERASGKNKLIVFFFFYYYYFIPSLTNQPSKHLLLSRWFCVQVAYFVKRSKTSRGYCRRPAVPTTDLLLHFLKCFFMFKQKSHFGKPQKSGKSCSLLTKMSLNIFFSFQCPLCIPFVERRMCLVWMNSKSHKL